MCVATVPSNIFFPRLTTYWTAGERLFFASYFTMGENTNNNTQNTADYLAQLLKDKKQLSAFPNVFIHVERLLDEGKKVLIFDLLVKLLRDNPFH